MSSHNEHGVNNPSLNFDNEAHMEASGPPNPYKTPDRLPNHTSSGPPAPPRLKKVLTSDNDEPVETSSSGIEVAYTANGSHNEVENMNAIKRYTKISREAKGWMVGPMPEEPFLDRFLPRNAGAGSAPDTPTKSSSHMAVGCGLMVNLSEDEIDPSDVPMCSTFESMQLPVKKEENLYEPLCTGLNASFEGPFRFVCTPNYQDPINKMKPDICLYREEIVKRFEKTNEKTKKTTYTTELSECDLFCEVKRDDEDDPCVDVPESRQEEVLPVSLGEKEREGNIKGFIKIRESEETQKKFDITIGQFASYAMAILSRQHRTHCFSIGIFGSKARLYRWDRSGVVISRAFNYKEKPWLTEFSKRYCQATATQRGYDGSVCRATIDEEAKFKEKIKEHIIDLYAPTDAKTFNKLMRNHYEEKRVFKVKIWPQRPKLVDTQDAAEPQTLDQIEKPEFPPIVQDTKKQFNDVEEAALALKSIGRIQAEDLTDTIRDSTCRRYAEAGQYQYFLISRPIAVPFSVAGRSTRGYWAVKIPDEKAGDEPNDYRICFLKDTWRMDDKDMEREGDVMVELYEAGVDYISDILCHCDVGLSEDEPYGKSNHETQTNKFSKEIWNFNNLAYTSGKHIHYRMVSKEVGCLLRELLGAYELLEATRMAFIAILQALVKRNRLHRDISINNILIIRKGGKFVSGTLIDWEFSCRSKGKGESRLYKRSGTWAFMSHNILSDTKHKHGLRDDMESLYYVVSYSGIRWLPHKEVLNLGEKMDNYFYDRRQDGMEVTGGSEKLTNIVKGTFEKSFYWNDKATRFWMTYAWQLQHFDVENNNTWRPERFMKVWTDALMFNPPKTDRCEHEIFLRGKKITDAVFPATNSVILGYMSHMMQTALVLSDPPASRSLKRTFEDAQRESDKPITEVEKTRMKEYAAHDDRASSVSKRIRQETPEKPEPFAENNVFFE